MSRFKNFVGLTVLIIVLDLITKYIAEKYLYGKTLTIIDGFFDLILIWNRGAAFGVLAAAPEIVRILILIIASVLAVIITVLYAYKNRDKLSNLQFYSLALISGGALGNLYDRIFLGKVRDFLDFHIGNYHWPAFNIADSSITVGIVLFIIYELFFKKKKN